MKNFFFLSILATALISSAFAQGGTLLNSSSSDSKFICGESQITDYDGNKYNTVQIGEQCWMKENLRTTCYSDGTPIPLYGDVVTESPSRHLPHNDEKTVESYGYLYNWMAATRRFHAFSGSSPNGAQGICPTGWHLPTDAEWIQLSDFVKSQEQYVCGTDKKFIAKALSSTTGWRDCTFKCSIGHKQQENNATGFSAVPAGQFLGVNTYDRFWEYACFWTATQEEAESAYYRALRFDSEFLYGTSMPLYKRVGCSVRCVKD